MSCEIREEGGSRSSAEMDNRGEMINYLFRFEQYGCRVMRNLDQSVECNRYQQQFYGTSVGWPIARQRYRRPAPSNAALDAGQLS